MAKDSTRQGNLETGLRLPNDDDDDGNLARFRTINLLESYNVFVSIVNEH